MKKVLEKRNDIVFYIKIYPLTGIHPEAYEKSKTIVCERSIKLLEDSYNKKKLPPPSCKTEVVDENIKLATSLGIQGAPTIVLPDGKVITGARGADDLIKLIVSEKSSDK